MEYKYKGPIIKKTYFCTLYLAKLDFNKSKYITNVSWLCKMHEYLRTW